MEGVRKPVSTKQLIAELEQGLKTKDRNRLEHPFVVTVAQGKATTNQIAGWRISFASGRIHRTNSWGSSTPLVQTMTYGRPFWRTSWRRKGVPRAPAATCD